MPKKKGDRKRRKQPEPYCGDIEYLQDEMAWIEARCRRMGSERKLESLGHGPLRLGEDKEREVEEIERRALLRSCRDEYGRQEKRLRKRIDARLAAGDEADRPTALCRLCSQYELNGFERTVLLLAVAPCIDRGFGRFYGQLEGSDRGADLCVDSVFAFMEAPVADRIAWRECFSQRGPLVGADLVTIDFTSRYSGPGALLSADIEITARTFSYLLGDTRLGDEFIEFSSVEEPRARLEQVVLAEADKTRMLSVVEGHDKYLRYRREWGFDDVIRYGRGVLMLFHGPPGTGKTMSAHAVAHSLGKRVLNVDIPTFVDHLEADRFLPGLFREARLQDAVLFFDECEAFFSSRRHGNTLMTMLLTEMERFDGVGILATNLPQLLDEALDRRILVKVRFPEPDRESRLKIWRNHLPEAAPLAEDVDLEALADRFEMSGGYIKNAILVALASAVHEDGDQPRIAQRHLETAARHQTHRSCEKRPELLLPKVRLADVILPAPMTAMVEELISAARTRRTVLERWGVGAHLSYGKGVSALFSGPPGTGKTLCAEAVANELNRPLLPASIPSILSKWVGQTEGNIETLFRDARTHQAVLLLDEADALLAERGEGRASRHDDLAVNTLLTLLERHNGLVLLATNKAETLDHALSRRLTYRLVFPRPDVAARVDIWKRLVPEQARDDGPFDFCELGRQYALSGGEIRNAVFRAAFRAASAGRRVSAADLEVAAEEERGSQQERGMIGFGARPVAC